MLICEEQPLFPKNSVVDMTLDLKSGDLAQNLSESWWVDGEVKLKVLS